VEKTLRVRINPNTQHNIKTTLQTSGEDRPASENTKLHPQAGENRSVQSSKNYTRNECKNDRKITLEQKEKMPFWWFGTVNLLRSLLPRGAALHATTAAQLFSEGRMHCISSRETKCIVLAVG
jgi:hypothetical protein